MRTSRLLALIVGSALTLTALVAVNLPSARASISSETRFKDKPVVGLAIKYRDQVDPLDLFGNLVGISAVQAQVSKPLDLGLGMWSVKFHEPKSEQEAFRIATKLVSDSRIETIYLDHLLEEASVTRRSPTMGLIKASSAPSNLVASDGWTQSKPNLARVKLTWKAPVRLNGGVLWGYRISKWDPVSGKYLTLVSNSQSKLTLATVSTDLVAGSEARFRVAAITRNTSGTKMAVSSSSNIASFTPTTTPEKPILQSSGTITSADPGVIWLPQTKSQKGGLAVSYQVSATASDQTVANCNTTSNSCTLSGLQAGKQYQVLVTATNARGSATSDANQEVPDPMFDKQWYLNSQYGINVEPAWRITKGNPSIVVAVVDSGITSHPDLNDNVVTGYDFISSASNARDGNGRDADPTDMGDYNSKEDSSWHGTHVAGIIAAASNSIGITGIAPNVKISPVRVLGVNGGSESDIAAGINWAIGVPISGVPTNRNVAKVVNLSIGSTNFTNCYSNSPTQLAIDAAKVRDVTLVTAAGNDNQYATSSYPGNCYGNITIGATGYYGDRSWYSNYSYYSQAQGVYIGVDISAPGGDDKVGSDLPANGGIWSTWNTGKTTIGQPTYESEMGTSMASPIAAGVVALMYSVKPNLTDDQVWEILSKTAKAFNTSSDCSILQETVTLRDGTKLTTGLCGIGIIDAGAAVLAVKALK
ncbi:MAG: S8 family serine peptidase [Rhodoluna sp.]